MSLHATIKSGYKQTEGGAIPEGWTVLTIAELAEKIIDYRGRTPKKLGMEWGGGDIPALSAGNVKMGHIDLDEETYWGSDSLYKRWMTNGDTRKDDVVLTTEAPLGNVALIPDARRYIMSQRTILLQTNPARVVNRFMFHLMRSQSFQRLLTENSTGSTAAGIKRAQFERLELTLPPIHEQYAITEVLSDVDKLLGAMNNLIAKKRDLKQAAIQQLLTGKRRLPGFSGEWEVKRLGQLCRSITDGTHFTPTYVSNGVPFYSVENVTADNFSETKFITRRAHNILIKRCKPEKGDILLTRIGSLGDTKLIDWDVDASIYVSLALLKPGDRVDSRYLYYYSKHRQFVEDLEARSLMNAAPKKINMGEIGAVPIPLPLLTEQTAIASILSDMDAELVALEQRRDKTRAIKLGMMQELLTGKTRLL